MRISDTDRQRATAAVNAVKRGDTTGFHKEIDNSIQDGAFLRFAYALAELGEVTEPCT
ncbi:hypothetical protein [Rhodococcus sp. 14-2496-1d]|uniref:hypothetical protein n=1 Tax=Rhodococcus sp. 14-2496-1d TaxID=2023146 RepID=UPI0015C65EF9|nr:hypothetical protein [Rhodococcus sp. 14-2496-1d]